MQMAGVDAGESKIFATLGAATNLLVDLEAVESEVQCGVVKPRNGAGVPPSDKLLDWGGGRYDEARRLGRARDSGSGVASDVILCQLKGCL